MAMHLICGLRTIDQARREVQPVQAANGGEGGAGAACDLGETVTALEQPQWEWIEL